MYPKCSPGYRSFVLYVVWPLKQQIEKLLFYKPRFWKKFDEWLVKRLAELIVVEVWCSEGFGWFRYVKAVSLADFVGDGLVSIDLDLVRKYFSENWLFWENCEMLPVPIVRDLDASVGQMHPLDLISIYSDLRQE